MLAIQDHWKRAGSIASMIRIFLKKKLSYDYFRDVHVPWIGVDWANYFYRKMAMEFHFYKLWRGCGKPYGDCGLYVDGKGEQSMCVNLYCRDYWNEDQFSQRLQSTLYHETTHALQYTFNLFQDEQETTQDKKIQDNDDIIQSEKTMFDYLTKMKEVDAELSSYYNYFQTWFGEDKEKMKNELFAYYHCMSDFPITVIKSATEFISDYVTTGVYNEDLRNELSQAL